MPPDGVSALMPDANPLLSLLAKLFPDGPHNALWLLACFFLQPVAAVYALRGMGETRAAPAIAVAVLAARFGADCASCGVRAYCRSNSGLRDETWRFASASPGCPAAWASFW